MFPINQGVFGLTFQYNAEKLSKENNSNKSSSYIYYVQTRKILARPVNCFHKDVATSSKHLKVILVKGPPQNLLQTFVQGYPSIADPDSSFIRLESSSNIRTFSECIVAFQFPHHERIPSNAVYFKYSKTLCLTSSRKETKPMTLVRPLPSTSCSSIRQFSKAVASS